MAQIVAGFLGALVLALLLIALAGAIQRSQLRADHPAPGAYADVGGYRLHFELAGRAQPERPTVVLEAGVGSSAVTFAALQPQIAEFAQVLSYDRAGLGWSERSDRPRTVAVMVEELHTLLAGSGAEPPYLLVGHSMGGLITRYYAHRYPDEVAGLVLLDSAHEEQYEHPSIKEYSERMNRMMPWLYGAFTVVNKLGLPALFPGMVQSADLENARAQDLDTFRIQVATNTDYYSVASDELQGLPDSYREMRQAGIASLGDLPLVVMSHGRAPTYAGVSEQQNADFERHFQSLQVELSGLSTRGDRVIAQESGHNVHIDQPHLVLQELRAMLGVQAAGS